MKNIILLFNNQKFRKKLFQFSLAISLIPVIFLGTFAFSYTRKLLTEREYTAIEESLAKEVHTLENRLDACLETMKLIIWNDGIRSALSNTYMSNADMYIAYRDVIDPTFKTIPTANADIKKITIYTDGHLNSHGTSVRKLAEISQKPWYGLAVNSNDPTFYYDGQAQELLLLTKVYYRYSTNTNVVCMVIDEEQLFEPLSTIFDSSYEILVADTDNDILGQTETIYRFSSVAKQDNFLSKSHELTSLPWTLTLKRPVSLVLKDTRNMAYTIISIIGLCLVLILLFAFVLSKAIVSPLESLAKNMKQVESGNLNIPLDGKHYDDEIGELMHAYQGMIERLRHLIDEVLHSKIKQQEYEMKALQAQINPHFLYNSLSMINNKAILSGQASISQMAILLSTFYRTTLNKGNNLISVEDELANTLSYAKIQRLMHSDSFDIIYEADEDALSYMMPNLLLQPLVENAILHGLDYKETPGKGVLTIMFYREDDTLVFKVMDNGKGMTHEQCNTLLASKSKGYGVRNVHKRVQLHCGTKYGLSFSSNVSRGTCVTLQVGIIK